MAITTCIFDAYGTLFDVGAAARRAADEPGRAAFREKRDALSSTWRTKQIEYTWHRQITGRHADFLQITEDALDYAIESVGLRDGGLRARLMELYADLDSYSEVPDVLARLKAAGRRTAILSNGTPGMLDRAVSSAGIGDHLDDLLSVEAIGVYKPDRRVYAMVTDRYGIRPEEVLFVSSNGWDIAGAALFGFRTAWVNRAGQPVERLPGTPDDIVDDLTAIPALADAA